jgi:hypothetical protein
LKVNFKDRIPVDEAYVFLRTGNVRTNLLWTTATNTEEIGSWLGTEEKVYSCGNSAIVRLPSTI